MKSIHYKEINTKAIYILKLCMLQKLSTSTTSYKLIREVGRPRRLCELTLARIGYQSLAQKVVKSQLSKHRNKNGQLPQKLARPLLSDREILLEQPNVDLAFIVSF